jgi:hypothetical protein
METLSYNSIDLVVSISISYPTAAQAGSVPAYLGGPLALTIWTDQNGYLDAAGAALHAYEYDL